MSMLSRTLWEQGGRHAAGLLLRTSADLGVGWRQRLLPVLRSGQQLSARAELFVSRAMRKQCGLAGLDGALPSNHVMWRLAYLPSARLERFMLHFGAVLVGREIRTVIGRQEVRAYQEAIGEELHWFTLRCAALMYTTDGVVTERYGPDGLRAAIRAAGRRGLASMGKGDGQALWHRLEMKLPLETDFDMEASDINVPLEDLPRIALRVFREIEST